MQFDSGTKKLTTTNHKTHRRENDQNTPEEREEAEKRRCRRLLLSVREGSERGRCKQETEENGKHTQKFSLRSGQWQGFLLSDSDPVRCNSKINIFLIEIRYKMLFFLFCIYLQNFKTDFI